LLPVSRQKVLTAGIPLISASIIPARALSVCTRQGSDASIVCAGISHSAGFGAGHGSVWASEASKLYNQGRKAEKAGQIARAYLLYSEAAALEPNNHLYWSRSLALQHARGVGIQGDAAGRGGGRGCRTRSRMMRRRCRPSLRRSGGSAQTAASHQTERRAGVKDFNLRANAKTCLKPWRTLTGWIVFSMETTKLPKRSAFRWTRPITAKLCTRWRR
jgi:hypothetical protein